MLLSQIPSKFQIPFANNAQAALTNPIPLASQIGITSGAASLTDGFPPVCFLPEGSGGTPPWGRDMNGLFNQISAWARWQAAGNSTPFDATFAAAIGGYPTGALIQSNSPGNVWVSIADNNTQDPNATPGNPGWVAVAFIVPIQNNAYISADDTGSADNYISAPSPAPTALIKYQKFQVKIANTNLTTTPTLNITGVGGVPLGAKTIVHPDGSALSKGELVAGEIASFIYDGVSKFQLQNIVQQGNNPTRVMEIISAFNQGVSAGPVTLLTSNTIITRNTMVTSSWNGSTLTVGTGEDGLWSLYTFMELFPLGTGYIFANLIWLRTRAVGGGTTWYWPTGTPLSQPNNQVITDLAVGDTVQLYGEFGVPNTPGFQLTGNIGPNVAFYRIEGLH